MKYESRSALALPAAFLTIIIAMTTSTDSNAQQAPIGPAPGPAARLPSLVVTGMGTVKATPDIAYVTVGVTTSGKRAQEASQANAAATEKVVAAVKLQGIAEKDIQTSSYNVQPVYREGNFARGIDSYQVSNLVRATVRKLAAIGKVIDSALDAGANNVQGVSFGLENRDPAEERALTQAVKEARRKAEIIARAAGVEIRGIQEIDSSNQGRPVPLYGGFAGEAMSARAATPISPGELDVTATVTIVYRIEAAKP